MRLIGGSCAGYDFQCEDEYQSAVENTYVLGESEFHRPTITVRASEIPSYFHKHHDGVDSKPD